MLYGSCMLNFPVNVLLHFVAVQQMEAKGQSDNMASDMEVHMKQRCVTEQLHAAETAPTDVLTLAECLWGPNNGCEHGEAVSGAFWQWQQQMGHICWCRFLKTRKNKL